MREIKFRAKALDKDFGIRYFELFEIGNWDSSCDIFYAGSIPCLISSIQQFTGLTDKNGKEIYEGDVMCDKTKDRPGKDIKVWVIYNSERACFQLEDNRKDGEYNLTYKNWEVIGDIFSSPELLTPPNQKCALN